MHKGLSPIEQQLYAKLMSLRKSESEKRNIPPYIICGETSLEQMAMLRPIDPENFQYIEGIENSWKFLNIAGIEEKKVIEYGEIFTNAIKEFCDVNKLQYNLSGVYKSGIYMPS
jgi:ATP-dependent DNA helicase RecQ